jgi:hypothetical protein
MERRIVQATPFSSILMFPPLSYVRYPLFVTKDSYMTKKLAEERM